MTEREAKWLVKDYSDGGFVAQASEMDDHEFAEYKSALCMRLGVTDGYANLVQSALQLWLVLFAVLFVVYALTGALIFRLPGTAGALWAAVLALLGTGATCGLTLYRERQTGSIDGVGIDDPDCREKLRDMLKAYEEDPEQRAIANACMRQFEYAERRAEDIGTLANEDLPDDASTKERILAITSLECKAAKSNVVSSIQAMKAEQAHKHDKDDDDSTAARRMAGARRTASLMPLMDNYEFVLKELDDTYCHLDVEHRKLSADGSEAKVVAETIATERDATIMPSLAVDASEDDRSHETR